MISRVVNDANTENINTKIPIVPYFTMPKAVAAIIVVAQEENIATVKLLEPQCRINLNNKNT